MDRLRLDRLQEQLVEWKITSIIVRQRDRLVAEWHNNGTDTFGPLYSCTKSVLSALIGIAVDKGYIESVEQPISSYFREGTWGLLNGNWLSESAWESGGSKVKALEFEQAEPPLIRIKDLLTMTPGYDWPDFDKPYKAFVASPDPVAFVLNKEIIHKPGESFTYNSGGSHLLSVILTQATGKSALLFAKEHLFEPLDFRRARWSERGGVNEGGTGLHLFGHDLAKLGVLYANNGRWGEKQVLSSDWVTESTRLHHRGLMHYDPPIYGGYGYHWWVSPPEHNGYADSYFAFGHGGQYLLIIPQHQLAVVIRKKITKRNDAIHSRKLIFDHIVPALIDQMQ